jgi:Domain of unknown function (DUF5666)
MKKAAVILSLLLTVAGSMAGAHEAGQHVMGTVTAIANGHLEVKTPKGEAVSVEVNDQTRYRSKGDSAKSLPQVGDRIVIDIAKSGGSLLATEIQFSGKKKKSEAAK